MSAKGGRRTGIQINEGCINGFVFKLWWNFRTKNSIRAEFMKNKYYRNNHPNLVMWKMGWITSLEKDATGQGSHRTSDHVASSKREVHNMA